MLTGLSVLAHQAPSPEPDGLWAAWNLHPLVVVGLAIPAAVYALGLRRGPRPNSRWPGRCAVLGLGTLAAALLSPLDALAGELASAHMVQHVLLTLIAAPLIALAAPLPAMRRGLPPSIRRILRRARDVAGVTLLVEGVQTPVVAWLLHVGALWVWHSAVLYEAALRNSVVHGVEHLSFIGTGILFWHTVLNRRHVPAAAGTGVLMLFTMALQGVFLSALLTFASTPWYDAYGATSTWGLDPLTDQQLAGLIMWIPGGFVYLGAALGLLVLWINDGGRDPTATEPSCSAPALG